MATGEKHAENKPNRGHATRVVIAGLNAWFCIVGYPWFHVADATGVERLAYTTPLLVLAAGGWAMGWASGARWLGSSVRLLLLSAFPVSVGATWIVREQLARPPLAIWALPWSAVALWVFLGVVLADTQSLAAWLPKWRTLGWRERVVTPCVIAGALFITTVAPQLRMEAGAATETVASMLATGVAIALSVAVMMATLGPAAITARKPTRIAWPQRVWQPLLVALVSGATFWLLRPS